METEKKNRAEEITINALNKQKVELAHQISALRDTKSCFSIKALYDHFGMTFAELDMLIEEKQQLIYNTIDAINLIDKL